MKSTRALLLLLFFTAGCRVYDNYTPPSVSLPEAWKESIEEEEEEGPFATEDWWAAFEEEDLDALMEAAMAANPTLQEAYWRIAEAQSSVQRAESFWFPSVDFNPNTQNTVQRANFTGLPDAGLAPARYKFTQYQLPFNAFYNLDLWGKVSYSVDAALADLGAQTYSYYNALLDLQSSVAEAYFRIRSLDAQNAVLANTIQVRQDASDVNSERFRVGLANFTDVSQAETELQIAKADLAQNRIERSLQEHRLATLLGEAPVCFTLAYRPLQHMPPSTLPTSPCQVLRARPDVQAAERRLAALFAEEGIAFASFFPDISFNAQIGYQSNLASNLLDWQSRLWSFTTNALQTVFDAGRKQADYEAAQARFRQGLASYATIVLNAIMEVEDALARLKWLDDQYSALNAASLSANTTRELSNERYLKGLENYLQVVTAERTLLSTQLNAIRTMGDEYQATISLMKSLGGKALLKEESN